MQICAQSPMLFNLYLDKTFKEIIQAQQFEVKVNSDITNNYQCADYTVILSDNI